MDLLNNDTENAEKNPSHIIELMTEYLENKDHILFNQLQEMRNELRMKYIKKIMEYEMKTGILPDYHYQRYTEICKITKSYKYLITVSFRDDIRPSYELMKTINKYKSKTNIKVVHKIAHEQRGETEQDMGNGYHIHIYLETYKTWNKQHAIRETYSTFKKFCSGNNYIDVRKIIFDNGIENYLSGLKSGNKLQKTIIDKLFIERYHTILNINIDANDGGVGEE